MSRVDFDELKSRYDLVEYIQRDLGQQGELKGGWVFFLCPLHKDVHPSLGVNPRSQRVTCFQHGCFEKDDILAYIMKRENISDINQAQDLLEGKKELSRPAPQVLEPPKPKKPIDQWRIDKLREYQDIAVPYFRGRGIVESVTRQRLLTYNNIYFVDRVYETLEGEKLMLHTPRFTIPNMFFGKARSVNGRLDENYIKLSWQQQPDFVELIRIDLAERQNLSVLPSDEDLIKHVYGPKYWKWTGSDEGIYNPHRLVTRRDGQYWYPPLSYLLVTKGEIKALALEGLDAEFGFMAVSIPKVTGLDLRVAFHNVKRVVIIADNDPLKWNEGKKEFLIAGEEEAEMIKVASGREDAEIIFPPDGYKDPDSMAAISPQKVIDWLTGVHGIPAVDRKILNRPLEMAVS